MSRAARTVPCPPQPRSGSILLVSELHVHGFRRVGPAGESWHVWTGGPIELHVIHADGRYECRRLRASLRCDEAMLALEAGSWRAARLAPGGRRALVGCSSEDSRAACSGTTAEALREHPLHGAIIRELSGD